MKKLKFLFAIFALTAAVSSCNPDEQVGTLTLTPDKTAVTADGEDTVVFTVKSGEEDVTSLAVIKLDGIVFAGNTFSTTKIGTYKFIAEYGGQSSAEVTITASELAVAAGEVSFSLGFEEAGEAGEAALPDNESKISDIAVAVFKADGTFLKVAETKLTGVNYSFEMEEGDWKVYVLANAISATELSTMLTADTSKESDFLKLMVDTELAKDKELPMASVEAVEFIIDSEDGVSLGEIKLRRMAARIDIINAMDDLTINKVVIGSYASAGAVDSETAPEGTGHLGEKTYDNLALEGDSSEPAILVGTIYSYDNANSTGDNATMVTVYYTLYGEELSTELSFDPGNLMRNNLYSIRFAIEGDIGADYMAETWATGDAITHEFSFQESMNRKLAVNRFTTTNVSTLDQTTGLVTFCATSNSEAHDTSADPNYFSQWKAEFASTIYTDAAGNEYRVPTGDEMRLIMSNAGLATSSAREWLGVAEALPDLFGIPGSGGAGTSDFRSLRNGDPANGPVNIIYGIRFKNTPQQAAYRYEFINALENNDNAYLLVRIKAIGMDVPELAEVCEETYWESEYIEFIFPLGGTAISGSYRNRGTHVQYWTSSLPDPNPYDFGIALILNNQDLNVNTLQKSKWSILRLVRAN